MLTLAQCRNVLSASGSVYRYCTGRRLVVPLVCQGIARSANLVAVIPGVGRDRPAERVMPAIQSIRLLVTI